jgi:uncharacterized protein with von Willebrand factor type A (vWA) domain
MIKKAEAFDWDAGQAPVEKDQENAVEHDSFDDLSYELLQDTVPALKKSMKNVANEHDYVPPAYQDLFNLLHGGDPEFVDYASMKEGYDANHEMLENMFGTPEFEELRKETAFDEYATAFTMLSMEDDIKEAFGRTKDAREARKQAMEALAQAQQALSQALQNAQQSQQQGQGQAQAGQGLQKALSQAEAAAQAAAAAQMAQQQAAQHGAQALQGAAKQAQKDLNEEEQAASAYGIGPGQLQVMPWEERRALTAELNHGKLKKLADMIGSWRMYADAERRRSIAKHPSEMFDVELGNNISRLVSTEINSIAIPELEDLFWLRYANQGLMQWQERGPMSMGKGPIILVCDESGSMGAPVDREGNTREMWSKAIGLALADQARRGKRDFYYIGFASGYEQWRLDFPNGETPIEKVKQFATHFFCGGTEYTRPLTMALEIMREHAEAGRPRPDIVFVTDDDCRVPDEFVENWRTARDEMGMTVYGVQIGGSAIRNTMPLLCDKTIDLTQINSDPEGMTELFRTII